MGGKKVRVIKRKRSEQSSEPLQRRVSTPVRDASREVKGVVSNWVREHTSRTEEFRRNYSALLKELGFVPPLSCRT